VGCNETMGHRLKEKRGVCHTGGVLCAFANTRLKTRI
jgi:hypothetical protein